MADPHEHVDRDKKESRTVFFAAMSICLFCICIGIPLWWKTTQTYRASLPYADIELLATQEMTMKIKVEIILFTRNLEEDELDLFLQSNWNAMKFKKFRLNYFFTIRKSLPEEEELWRKSKSDLNIFSSEMNSVRKSSDLIRIVVMKQMDTLRKAFVSNKDICIVSADKYEQLMGSMELLLRENLVDESKLQASLLSSVQKRNEEAKRELKYHSGYDVTFTLLNSEPEVKSVKWNIERAINDYLQPFVQQFQYYSTISIKSQYLFGIALNLKTAWQKDHFSLRRSVMSQMINPIESHLGSHVNTNPNVNFVVYVPRRRHSPLYVTSEAGERFESNSFFSPQWGGMVIHNVRQDEEWVELDMKPIMETFLSQLKCLMGLKEFDGQLLSVEAPGNNTGISHHQLMHWLRRNTLENIATSVATLKSLVELLNKVGNIVIKDNIATEVSRAVDCIQRSQVSLRQGEVKSAFLLSRQALLSSEKAFFDQSLLELLYFPQDQKFAIYIPLFAPVGLPVLQSVYQVVAKYFRKPKQE